VGKQLKQLSEHAQLLCVTHQPQVAAQGHQHLKIEKHTDNNKTFTKVTQLKDQARTQEIARMLGGIKITDQTLAHAEEMLA